MTDSSGNHAEEPKGFLEEVVDGYRRATKKVDEVIGGLGALACQPVVGYGAGVDRRSEGPFRSCTVSTPVWTLCTESVT